MKAQFQDVQIIGMISERCYPVEGTALRIHLQLSQHPPLGWAYLFSQVWQAVEYPGKRPVGIENGELWIECRPEEVRADHLPHLERALDETSARYCAQRRQKQIAMETQRELSSQTHMKLDELARSFEPLPQFPEETGGPAQSRFGRVVNFLRRAFGIPAKKILEERSTPTV